MLGQCFWVGWGEIVRVSGCAGPLRTGPDLRQACYWCNLRLVVATTRNAGKQEVYKGSPLSYNGETRQNLLWVLSREWKRRSPGSCCCSSGCWSHQELRSWKRENFGGESWSLFWGSWRGQELEGPLHSSLQKVEKWWSVCRTLEESHCPWWRWGECLEFVLDFHSSRKGWRFLT